MPGPETILVVETGRLGDLVMVAPMLETLRRGAPESRIVVAGGWPLPILERHPCVDGLVHVAHPNPRWVRLWYERMEWTKWLRDQRCRAVLICHAHDHRVWEVAARRVGVPRVVSDRLLAPEGRHHSERLNRLAEEVVGGPAGPAPPVRVFLGDEEREEAARRLAAMGRDVGRRLVGVHVGTHRLRGGHGTASRKMWPMARWQALLPDLVRERGVQVLLTGTAAERDSTEAVAAVLAPGAALNLCGETGVRQLAGAIAACDLLITPDTGPMHVAAALDVPLVALFSVTDSAEFGPRGASGRHTIVESAAPCRGCGRQRQKTCRDLVCLADLTVERVRVAADAWLEQVARGEARAAGPGQDV